MFVSFNEFKIGDLLKKINLLVLALLYFVYSFGCFFPQVDWPL